MKTLVALFSLFALTLSINAADAPAKKKAPSKKAPTTEAAKPSAKVEAIAKTLTPTQRTKLLNVLNEGDEKALTNLPGIGDVRAKAVSKARPFSDVTDVVRVEGVGETTFAEMVAHAKAGFPQAEKKEAPATEKKKKANPAKKKAKAKS